MRTNQPTRTTTHDPEITQLCITLARQLETGIVASLDVTRLLTLIQEQPQAQQQQAPAAPAAAAVTLHITTSTAPAGKLADVEMHFLRGPLAGSKLIGFAVWLRRTGQGWNVTFPARSYQVNGERRSFALLRPADGLRQDSTTDLRDLVLHAYAQHVAAGTPPEITRWTYTEDRHPVEVSQAETPSDPHEDRVHQLRPDLGTSRTTCGRDSQSEGGATVEIARITCTECLDALYIETTTEEAPSPFTLGASGPGALRRISCGCCTGPEADRCTCPMHQDTPRGIRPRTCNAHATDATDQQPITSQRAQGNHRLDREGPFDPDGGGLTRSRNTQPHQDERHRMPELPTPQLITTPLKHVRRVF